MENAAHTLSGLVLARLGPDRQGPWATALLATAANFPDVDCVSLFFGQEAYLGWHHGITHSLLGVAIAGPLLGWFFFRLAAGKRPDLHLKTFVLLAYAGLAMHCLLDAMLSYGIRPFLPFDGTWHYADVVHVVDPWIWITLGAGAILGGSRRGLGFWSWVVFATTTLGITIYLGVGTGRTPAATAWTLGGLWTLVLGLRRAGVGLGRRPGFARWSLYTTGLYLVALAVLGTSNESRAVDAISTRFGLDRSQIETTSRIPRVGIPWRHRVIVQTADTLYRADVFDDRVEIVAAKPRNLDDPGLDSLVPTATYATWKEFARHPFCQRTGSRMILGDARYGWSGRPSWCNLEATPR